MDYKDNHKVQWTNRLKNRSVKGLMQGNHHNSLSKRVSSDMFSTVPSVASMPSVEPSTYSPEVGDDYINRGAKRKFELPASNYWDNVSMEENFNKFCKAVFNG